MEGPQASVGRLGMALERLKHPVVPRRALLDRVGRLSIAFERLKCSQDHPVRPKFVGWNTCYRVGAFEARPMSAGSTLCVQSWKKRQRI